MNSVEIKKWVEKWYKQHDLEEVTLEQEDMVELLEDFTYVFEEVDI